jgi:hypothetical protein
MATTPARQLEDDCGGGAATEARSLSDWERVGLQPIDGARNRGCIDNAIFAAAAIPARTNRSHTVRDQNAICPDLSRYITLVKVTTDTKVPIRTATDAGSTQVS